MTIIISRGRRRKPQEMFVAEISPPRFEKAEAASASARFSLLRLAVAVQLLSSSIWRAIASPSSRIPSSSAPDRSRLRFSSEMYRKAVGRWVAGACDASLWSRKADSSLFRVWVFVSQVLLVSMMDWMEPIYDLVGSWVSSLVGWWWCRLQRVMRYFVRRIERLVGDVEGGFVLFVHDLKSSWSASGWTWTWD